MPTTLEIAIEQHNSKERVSFHTPGHKGRSSQIGSAPANDQHLSWDLTELPGLDDLYQPSGVLSDLEARAAKLWGAHSSLLSVNGASAGLIAAIMTLSRRGSQILLPRNCHRSIIHALILSGLEPIWFEPLWEEAWGIWGPVSASDLASVLKNKCSAKVAGLLIVSPTYAGALSDIGEIATLCHEYELPLVVDEAHATHHLLPGAIEQSALNSGADLVVHSLHKILSGLTQTGVAHLSYHAVEHFAISSDELRAALNLIQSSSPSYIFLRAMDELISSLESGDGLAKIERVEHLGANLRQKLQGLKNLKIYQPACGSTNSHLLLGGLNSPIINDFLIKRGIYPESLLGLGLLLLLGTGTNESDVDSLVHSLNELEKMSDRNAGGTSASAGKMPALPGDQLIASACKTTTLPGDQSLKTTLPICQRPEPIEQVLSPRDAFYKGSRSVSIQQAIGQIASECVAPCPPGWPLLIPGQRVKEDCLHLGNLSSVKIVVQSD